MSPADYLSAEAFKAKIFALCEKALLDYSGQAILAFPEVIGLPLLFAKDYQAMVDSGLQAALLTVLKRDWRALVATGIKHKLVLKSLYFHNATAAFKIYKEVFAAAAKEFDATIVAGSIFLPELDTLTSAVQIKGRRVYNYSYSFLPSSKTIVKTGKVNLTGLEQKLLLSNTDPSENYPFEVNNHKIGVAICLDGFYDSIVSRYDALGASIIIQPSANFASWNRPWPQDPDLREGEAWLRYGLREQIQNRENIIYGLNPMLVGELFGMKVQGRSNIAGNQRFIADRELEGYRGLLAIAKSFDQEELVCWDFD